MDTRRVAKIYVTLQVYKILKIYSRTYIIGHFKLSNLMLKTVKIFVLRIILFIIGLYKRKKAIFKLLKNKSSTSRRLKRIPAMFPHE